MNAIRYIAALAKPSRLNIQEAEPPVALLTAREQGEAVVVGELPKEVRLVCFDMDATLIRMETINRIAQEASIGKRMEELNLRAMSE